MLFFLIVLRHWDYSFLLIFVVYHSLNNHYLTTHFFLIKYHLVYLLVFWVLFSRCVHYWVCRDPFCTWPTFYIESCLICKNSWKFSSIMHWNYLNSSRLLRYLDVSENSTLCKVNIVALYSSSLHSLEPLCFSSYS